MQTYHFTIAEDDEEIRIDRWLIGCIDSLSRSYIQKLIKDEQLSVNGKCVKASYVVHIGDSIDITVPDAMKPDIEPENIALSVLYEDNDVLVVDKPKGMVVHPAAGHASGTLVNALLYYCKDSLSGINGIMRPGIVHRIDKDTTGSLIICKNDAAHTNIAQQLKEHTITRKYIAIVYGVIKDDEGVIDAPIGRSSADRKKMAVLTHGGKDAVTHFRVLKRYKDFTYVECVLETGRTHQIRVHMSHIGHPLLGDEVYAPGRKCKFAHLEGQTLHAMVLGFRHPVTGEYIETVAPVPAYFQHLLDILPIA
ncbi:MAG: RluA family pseudouridine synthase [Lachnospiraceae bacterium]|nr:RluA family pseudouridine synthase [Lachnospiraceae bacterium]